MHEPTPIPESADADLLGRVAQGDSDAFSSLYDRFSPVLFPLALKILRDPVAAEDLLQDVFVQIWEKAGTYDARLGKPLTWAVTLTRNRAIDRLRAAQRGQRLVEAATQEQAVAEDLQAGAGDELFGREAARAVREALNHLPKDQRQAIEMAFFGGLSQSEIAGALQVPLGTVKARIRRGMMQLRDAIESSLGGEARV